MISKKDLKGLEFETMDDYFNYIVESKENGQFEQVNELINKLSQSQYNSFLIFIKDNGITMNNHFLRQGL